MNYSDLVLAISPCGELHPSPRLVAEARRGGGIAVLDLGDGEPSRLEALRQAASWSAQNIGVRLSADCAAAPAAVREASDDRVDLVVLTSDAGCDIAEITAWARVLVEVTSQPEARAAAAAGASGLIARGAESGGRVGELSTFVLLQQLVADGEFALPVWAAGGIGPRTAAACVVGGAAGIVLDSQLALMPESDLPDNVLAVLRRMDGSETTVSGDLRGVRVHGPQRGSMPSGELLLIGQDGCQAAPFARRWRGTAAAVRGVRSAILDALEDRHASRVLLSGAPLASSLGIDLPVAQGPMTRVSDEAAFAAAVADNGGLPFIALALADREKSAAMLDATRAMLGDRPWGVGILGFLPEDLRAAQVEVVREMKPSCAIIAGGHPVHATALEKEGISAFLHVPSPKLLRQFLQAGSRRFVFEGAECGGHVGPRTSFTLWEAQLDVLAEFLDSAPPDAATEVQVWFAGGIHDARSAAMIAALAAPLSRRGVQIGLLMGTAYLFTREAVTGSAIQPLFQRKALAATATALLETAPGQSIRCLASQYVAEFEDKRADLTAAGLDKHEIWQQLELMNIGRLRLASKGREHDGSQINEDIQSAQGMYMAGQIAVLRDSPTTIAELHRDVTTGADHFYSEQLNAQSARRTPASAAVEEPSVPLDIAVIGMACAFPGAADADGFWDMILKGTDAISDVPKGRWDPATRPSPRRGAAKRSDVVTSGAFLDPLPIDPVGLGIPPGALGRIDPAQLIALEIARRTLIDAGYPHDVPRADHARTGVVFGAQGGSELEQAITLRGLLPVYLGTLPPELDEQLPKITKDTFPGLLTNVIAGRIANRLDLGGPNFIVDAACAASLAAVDVACKNLATGAADLMLCGGVDLHNSLLDYLMFDSVHALSPGGRPHAFDSTADGTALGEGVGCIALKRLADARRDGDRIYAVIAGVGAASDGRTTSLTAPHSAGQVRALGRAYHQAGVRASEVGLVEAHGTGTITGDEVELQSLTSYFAGAGAPPGSCVLGSVKSQIGHTKGAAGIAGMIKAVLSVYHGVQPPTINLAKPLPKWDPERSPFCFLTRPRPWAAPATSRVAAVSAIGFGGANFHVVLKGIAQAPVPRHGLREWPAELFCFHGTNRAAAHRVAAELAGTLSSAESARHQAPLQLRTLAARLIAQRGSRAEPVQLAVVARSVDELQGLLQRALAGEHDPAAGLVQPRESPSGELPRVAFLFPGQGSQRPAALADLFVHFSEMRAFLEACPDVASLLFPAAAFDVADQREAARQLRRTSAAQPALGVSGVAVHHLLRLLGVRPDMMAGHSYGELVALCCAGAYDVPTLLGLSHERAAAILSAAGADPGTMAAVRATADEASAVLSAAGLADDVVIANHNAPRQVTISGPSPAVADAVAALRAAGLSCSGLPVACAFHSPVLAGAGDRFADALASRPVVAPQIPVWSNRTAAPYPDGAGSVRAELAAQVESPVRFAAQVEAMYEAGARVFIETGPGQVLTGLVREILSGRPHLAVACDAQPDEAVRGLLTTLGQLACSGVPVNAGWLLRGRAAADPLAAQEREPSWYADGVLVRDSRGAATRGSVTPTGNVKRWKMPAYGSDHNPPSKEELLGEYLRLSREAVLAHRDVMLSVLGDGPGLRPAVRPLEAEVAGVGSVQLSPTLPQPNDGPAPEPALVTAPAPARPARDDLPGLVVATICESTGYPPDIVDLDLDLEAELGIDSIKRAEIAGEMAVKLGMSADAEDSEIGDLIKARTVRDIVAWLAEQAVGRPGDAPAGDQALPPANAKKAVAAKEDSLDAPGTPPSRLLPKLVTASLAPGAPQIVKDARFLITGETRVGEALAEMLRELGALPHAWRPGSEESPELAEADGLILLDGLADSADALPVSLFPVIKAALRDDERPDGKGLRWLLAAGLDEASESAGMAGLLRTADLEYPQAGARYVALDRAVPPAEAAGWLLAELLSDVGGPAVGYRDGGRYVRELAPAELTVGTDDDSDAAAARALGLDQDSVVVVVGGARGISAGVARALASASGCRIELMGRTVLPSDDAEAPDIAAAADLTALHAALSAGGALPPAEVNRRAASILAQREVRSTMAELHSLGSSVAYRSVDIRDEAATRQAVEAIRAAHGRVDGLVFAAGVIEDKLIAEKTVESFARVFDTKVAGARAVLNALDEQGCDPRFTVLFGSLAAYGSRGQADYAAANDALEALGASWSSRSGRRCVTVHWGPWAPVGAHAGMVSPGLAQQFVKRGIGLIDPEEGVRCLLRELAWGPPAITAVAYVASPQNTSAGVTAHAGGPQ
jgi:acyl transferase domain-containing protein/NAD(P)H-dependent flavin oxidoreductase YrpB (nitropropane dioxygenase family)/NAD(P)-dependent dehydrogenase (short-subunit alcohol dehydrogenase family)/acyl carrier protein